MLNKKIFFQFFRRRVTYGSLTWPRPTDSSVLAGKLLAGLDLQLLAVVSLEVVQTGAAVVAGLLRLLAGAAVLTGARQALIEIFVAAENNIMNYRIKKKKLPSCSKGLNHQLLVSS